MYKVDNKNLIKDHGQINVIIVIMWGEKKRAIGMKGERFSQTQNDEPPCKLIDDVP